ncbi:hypothetical protein Daesc_004203 [Daldinia eschscholtzii]|uniref:PI4-kinase N-terminal domain-containing protein n=1 Tax=Daldinia eschscholtzii TaxID=292717 RepID=A0AAX6MPB0_9PEZI
MARNIRQQALQKIAVLSATSSTTSFDKSDLDRLCRATNIRGKGKEGVNGSARGYQSSLARVPMTIREFEVLVSLCKAAPMVQSSQSAQKLVSQLIPYILEAHAQTFLPSPAFSKIEPSPIEALTSHVTAALLSLGNNYDDLHETVSDNIWALLAAMSTTVKGTVPLKPNGDAQPNLDDAIHLATIAISLLGFLDAASAQANFWRSGGRLALIRKISNLLSESFLTAVDGAFSTIRNVHASDRNAKDWKRILRHYANQGRPLGSMLLQRSFMWLLVSTTSLLIADVKHLRTSHILDLLMSKDSLSNLSSESSPDPDFQSIELYASIAQEEMDRLEASADFIELGSSAQQRLACAVKAAAIISFLNCSVLNEDAADPEILMGWLQESLDNPMQMVDETLASTVFRSMAILAKISPNFAPAVVRLLPRFIVQTTPASSIVATASKCLAFTLRLLSQDAVITTLYTLGNVLSPDTERSAPNGSTNELNGLSSVYQRRQSTGSDISLQLRGDEDTTLVYANIVQAICSIAEMCDDEKITALSQAMTARNHISANVKRDSPLYDIYWDHILEELISKGDVHQSQHMKESDVEFAALEIAQLLQPLAILMSRHEFTSELPGQDDDRHSLIRDVWFNIVVHGFTSLTERGKKYINELRIMAIHSPPLVAEQRGEQVESDIELNTVLRRANTSDREAKQKRQLTELVPSRVSQIRSLSYRKVMFLQAAYLVESLRADSGDCTKTLSYFLEPSMRNDDVRGVMEGITAVVMEKYLLKTLEAKLPTFSALYAASQLAAIFCGCCHRIQRVQQAAFYCADKFVREIPSSLCQKSSLFALLELLSLMWTSCLEAETEMYDPRSVFTSRLGNVTVELSDDYAFRRATLNNLYTRAKTWVAMAINLAPSDVKGLLQTYLSEFQDEGVYGHMSLGRSLAVEMGSSIPATDQRLTSLDPVGQTAINTASHFVAQYTTRQEYRYGEALPSHGKDLISIMPITRRDSFIRSAPSDRADAVTALAHVGSRLTGKKITPLNDVRDILRRAAALLCRSGRDESAITHYLVSIPFKIFTKESINFGVSLWLGVINENPRMESRILAEIAQQWEIAIHNKLGLFNPTLM